MIILQPQQAVFVGVPRAGSKAMSLWLEKNFRAPGYALLPAEALNDYHATLAEAAQVTDLPLFNWWSFAVVRNPFERLVSYCAQFDPDFVEAPQRSLERALVEPANRWTMPQHELLDGVKTVYRFEDIDKLGPEIGARLGLVNAPVIEKENETAHLPYRNYFTPVLRELAEHRYGPDLLVYNYGY